MRDVDTQEFRRVLGHYPTGVCVVTAGGHPAPVAMVVGSFTSVSLAPPLVGFFPDRRSTSWPLIRAAGRFCVNVLGDDQHDLCRAIASKSANPFERHGHRVSPTGAAILEGVVAWIDCDLHAVHAAGDHDIAIGQVRDLAVERAGPPLIFSRGGYGSFAPHATPARSAA